MPTVAKDQMGYLPQNRDAEVAVIGSLLLDPNTLLDMRAAGLKTTDFMGPSHGWIYEAACTLMDRGEPITSLTIGNVLGSHREQDGRSRLDVIGGQSELWAFIDETTTSANADAHARIIRNKSIRRRAIALGAEIVELAQTSELPESELVPVLWNLCFEALVVESEDCVLHGGREAIQKFIERMRARGELLRKDPHALTRTGLATLDRTLIELSAGSLIAVMAATSVGKTMLMETIAEYNAFHGRQVLYYHLEQTHDDMLGRCIARVAKIPFNALRVGDVEWMNATQRALDTPGLIVPWHENITYISAAGWTADRIAIDMMLRTTREGAALAIVDYLQMIEHPEQTKGRNPAQMRGAQTQIIKTTGIRLGIPVILGSQVNRAWGGPGQTRPTMDNARDTGEYVEKANVVLVLHRPQEQTDPNGPAEDMELYIDKHTMGEKGKIDLVHTKGRFMIGEHEYSQLEPAPKDEGMRRAAREAPPETEEIQF